MPSDHTAKIIRELEKVAAGGRHSPSDIFKDWLRLVHASLTSLPVHFASVSKTGQLAQDGPETRSLWLEIKERYSERQSAWEHFSAAFAYLLKSTDDGYQDVVGEIFMSFGNPNPRSGQFFTPMPVAVAMAKMTLIDIDRMLWERIEKAVSKHPEAKALMLVSLVMKDSEARVNWLLERLLPLILADIEPITVMEPACGSGVMILAAASACPRWALDYGLIQFYGVDLDPLCVLMAQINLMLYGLNGYSLKCALQLSDIEIRSLPLPYAEKYQEAKIAEMAGDKEAVEKIAADIRQLTLLPDLFGTDGIAQSHKKKHRHKQPRKQLILDETPLPMI